jgi:hypothetical protein
VVVKATSTQFSWLPLWLERSEPGGHGMWAEHDLREAIQDPRQEDVATWAKPTGSAEHSS